MLSIHSPREMQERALKWRMEGLRVSFVPTMGALHEGHMTLLREGKKLGDKLVLSIFVNPKQFSPNEDLAKYPRDIEGDLAKARACGVDAVFFPTTDSMYPEGFQTFVEVTDVTEGLCGKTRPTHFRGVATVVLKLINIVQPNVMLLGEKDYQQLVTLRTMANDLNIPVEIRGVPIVREADGLAMSSRNAYLSKEERASALSLSRSLLAAQEAVRSGNKEIAELTALVRKMIEIAGPSKIDYISICSGKTLKELKVYEPGARLLVAAYFGKTRLIDNCGFE